MEPGLSEYAYKSIFLDDINHVHPSYQLAYSADSKEVSTLSSHTLECLVGSFPSIEKNRYNILLFCLPDRMQKRLSMAGFSWLISTSSLANTTCLLSS